MANNSGFKAYLNLQEYYLDNNLPTGIIKPNDISDPDYVSPVFDNIFCPPPSVTPSVTPTSTPSPSETPSVTPSISLTPSLTATPSLSATPSLTPSKTPSVTPSISLTPSLTPSISLTPSETPSPTPSLSTEAVRVVTLFSNVQFCTSGGNAGNYVLAYTPILNRPITSNVSYVLQLNVVSSGGTPFNLLVSGTIIAGNTIDNNNNNPCTISSAILWNIDWSLESYCLVSITPTIPTPFESC